MEHLNMAYKDWNHELNADTNHTLSDQRFIEGNASLLSQDSTTNSVEVLSQSETDSPTEARIDSSNWTGFKNSAYHYIFRWQDGDNFYSLSEFNNFDKGGTYLHLYKRVGGTVTEVDALSVGTYSDGSAIEDTWHRHRVNFWVDSSGSVRARVEEDADGDGTYTTRGGGDLVDSNPSLSAGGGVGVGTLMSKINVNNTGSNVHYDKTEVFY